IDRLSMQSVMPKPWHNYWLKEPLPHLAHLPAHELALVTQLLTEEVRDMVKLSHQGALIAFPEGMGSIPKAMAKSLRDKPNVEIKLGQSISKVEFDSAARKVMLSTADGASPAAYDKEAKLVLGGEVTAWSESIDAVSLDTVLWPRTSAAGEVLWSGRTDASGQNRSQYDAAPRLAEFRERMVARGVGSAPVHMPFCTQASPEECAFVM
ncbi:hypothetical protein BN1723_017849, partial [Verticillium longisporum]